MSTAPARKTRPANGQPSRLAACPIILLDHEICIPASAHTLAGFRAWATSDDFPERGRFSFIDGEIYIDMSPEELETHVKVKVELGYVLVGLNKKLKLGEFYSDGALVSNPAANLSTEPDAIFITWETLEAGRVRLVPREGAEGQYIEVEGTPDWVVEVVSKYSVGKDTRRLRKQYHRAGVPEYWLIDARSDAVDFQILVREEADYRNQTDRGGWQTSPLFGRRFRLVRKKGRMGLWEYTLQAKKR
jgi:Uma2 family endonuclease